MNNSELELELIAKFGTDNVIRFADMVSYMYELLYRNAKERSLENEFDYGYDAKWWKNKYKELINTNYVIKKVI